jgi:hypothetical protein
MSIEKIDFSYIRQEKKSFTTNLNIVIQNLLNPVALGIWIYLSSLPEGWVVNKEHLRKHFNLGRDKLDAALLYLAQNMLIEIGQERLDDGKMGKGYINVKCGYDFVVDCNAPEKTYPQETPFTEKPLTVQPLTAKPGPGKSAPIKEIKSSYKTNKEQREGSLSNFQADESNTLLCRDLGLSMKDELESFHNRHKGEKNQYEFGRWLKNSHEYRKRKQGVATPGKVETHSPVQEWKDPYGHIEQASSDVVRENMLKINQLLSRKMINEPTERKSPARA